MKAFLAQLDKRSLREKLLLTAMVLAALVAAVDFWVIGPLQVEQKGLRAQLATTEGELLQLETALVVAQARVAADPDEENRGRLTQLRQQTDLLDQELAALFLELIAPRDMPAVLKELLQRQAGLRLLSLENLLAEPLLAPEGAAQDSALEAPNVYRHGLKLEFSGSYQQILTYLQALEGLGRKMFWTSLDLQVEAYPRSRVVLKVYTLSLKKEWIGV